MQRWLGILVLCAHTSALAGCSLLGPKRQLDYRTVQSDPHHDTDRAKAENERALKLLENGKLDKAETALQKSLLADVTYGPAHNNLGKLYYHQHKFYLAAWEFEYANKLMPHRPECQNNLGLVYEAVGKLDEAIDSYSAAYAADPKNPVVIGNLARAHIRRGDDDPVVRQLLADLKLYDSRPDWVAWAGERLAVGPLTTVSGPVAGILPTSGAGVPRNHSESDTGEQVPPPQPLPESPRDLPSPDSDPDFEDNTGPSWPTVSSSSRRTNIDIQDRSASRGE